MKKYTNIKQVNKDIVNEVLNVNDDIEIAFDGFEINADIKCRNIYSKDYKRNIKAWNIDAYNIKAGDIDARDIDAVDIKAWNIDAYNIKAVDIDARDINAWDIKAEDINAYNIKYCTVCFAYGYIKCNSIKGNGEKAKHFCLDGNFIIKKPKKKIIIDGKEIEISEDSFNDLKEQLCD